MKRVIQFFWIWLVISLKLCLASVITQANGNERLGWYSSAGMKIANVGNLRVMQNYSLGAFTEQFYAQPLVYHDLVFAVSMQNNIYQIDGTTGTLLKMRNVGIPFDVKTFIGCGTSATTGILGTPVVDVGSNRVYFVSKSYKPGTAPSLANGAFYLHAIDWNTWDITPGFPVQIEGKSDNIGKLFEAGKHLQRPALLLHKGRIIVSFGSNCDLLDFHGWLFSFDRNTGKKLHSYSFASRTPYEWGSSVWQSGVGPSGRANGDIYLVTGNAFNTSTLSPTPGRFASSMPLGNSIVRLQTETLTPVDFFTPNNQAALDQQDLDSGDDGLMLLPPFYFGNQSIGVTAGKDGYMYVVNLDDLGGYRQAVGGGNLIQQKVLIGGGKQVLSGGAVFPPERTVFFGVKHQPFMSLKYDVATQMFSVIGKTERILVERWGSPVLTSSGTSVGSGLIWFYDYNAQQLVVIKSQADAGGILQELRTWNVASCRFSSPYVVKGKVYMTTCDGRFILLG